MVLVHVDDLLVSCGIDFGKDLFAKIAQTLEAKWFALHRADAEGSFLGRMIRRTEVGYELTGDWKIIELPINELGLERTG